MKKRIIALLCTFALLLSSLPSAFAAFPDVPEGTKESQILQIINNLGIMNGYPDGTFGPDQPITRAEFVTTIFNAVNAWENVASATDDGSDFNWKEFFLGGGTKDFEILYPSSGSGEDGEVVEKSFWSDVDIDYWAYPYMKTVATFGHVVGYPDGTFRPTQTVTYYEAITILLNLCGYKEHAIARGGFPDGYNTLANRFNLSKGLYATGYQELSRMDAATLIFNAFEMEIAPNAADANDEGRTFLNDIVGVYIVEGTLTDTDVASIYRDEPMKKYNARVNDINFTFSAADVAIRDYIGQEVRIYLTETDDDGYLLKSYDLIGKEDVTVIDADLFEDFDENSNTFYYKTDADDKNNKKVKVRNGSTLIYNGKYKSSYSAEDFLNINKGTITVIEKDELDIDIIVVEDYKSGYTSSVNGTELEIYDTIAEGVGNSIISLSSDDANANFVYQLMDADGNTILLDAISDGAINYYVSDNFVKLYYSNKTVSGNLTRRTDDGNTYYVVNGEEYKISDRFLQYNNNSIRSNVDGTITLDRYNEVVWMTDNIEATGYVYIIKTRYDYENSQPIITYYDIDANEVKENVYVLEDAKFYGTSGKKENITGISIKEAVDRTSYDGIAKIELNDDGVVKTIRLALDKQDETTNQLQLVKEYIDLERYRNTMGFDGEIYLNANSKMISIPNDVTDYRKFTKLDYSKDKTYIDAKLYSFDPDSPYAKIALIYESSTTSQKINVETSTQSYLVTKIADSINENGELVTEATLYDGTNYTTVTSLEDENGLSAFDTPFKAGAITTKSNDPIGRGDFIMYLADEITGDVTQVRQIYDADGINPAWCSADPANKETTCSENHTHTTTLGHIPGTTGFYSKSSAGTYTNTNPIGFTNESIGTSKRVPGIRNNYHMYALGFVYQTKEGLTEWTTQNIKTGSAERDSENYQWIFDNFEGVNPKVFIIKDDMTIENGNLQSIKSYKDAGNKCSKILMKYISGSISQIWILPE